MNITELLNMPNEYRYSNVYYKNKNIMIYKTNKYTEIEKVCKDDDDHLQKELRQ